MVKPKASSTPKIVNVSRRRPIGDVNNDSVQSPIYSYKRSKSESSSENHLVSNSEEEENCVDVDETDTSGLENQTTNTVFGNCINPLVFVFLTIILSLTVFLYCYTEEQNGISVMTLSEEFPSQVDDFWLYIQKGIEDIKEFHKPRTFIFLYKDTSRETLERILKQITVFATCTLTNCSALPIVLEASDLSAPDILKDYGEIISRNKDELEKSGVMIIKNLEKIPGVSAQAFHSFCDEYYPVVENALFIFTMRVDNYYDNNLRFLETYLHNHWNDITDDKFYALFTRIANVVLPIMSEN